MIDIAEAWHAHRAAVAAFVRRRLANEADAEDVVQETFLRLQRHAHALEDGRAVLAWLLRTARNLVIDHYRAARPLQALREEPVGGEVPLPTPLQTLEPCIGPLAAKLPEKYREALALELAGVPQQAIAARQGLGLSGAKSRVQRARVLLRREFDRCCRFRQDEDGRLLDYRERAAETC